jgi:uncharacterized protein
MEELGKISRLRRYPVKSMRGEDLETAQVETYGVAGDRLYAYVLDHPPNPRFPWMTAREASEMLLYKPQFRSPGEIVVTTPGGGDLSISNLSLEESLEQKYGHAITLIHKETGCHDSKPISLLGLETARLLEKETHIETLAPERFRANIYADWDTHRPFFEDELVGKEIQIGKDGVVLKVVKKDSRCVIPTLDPETSRENPQVLQTIKEKHGGCFGVYAEVVSVGTIKLADRISLV